MKGTSSLTAGLPHPVRSGAPLPALERKVIGKGYDRNSCWVHARCCLIHPSDWSGEMILTLQRCIMGTSEDTWDIFTDLSMMKSADRGKTWSAPQRIDALKSWSEGEGRTVVISDFTPQWHHASGKVIGIGHTCRYIDGKLMPPPRPRETAYSVYDPDSGHWLPPLILEMGDPDAFFCSGAGCAQWIELPDGDLLLPIYYKSFESSAGLSRMTHAATSVRVLRCRFDGQTLTVIRKGLPLETSAYRGFGEPSLAAAGGGYWLTLRNGEKAYLSFSQNGIDFAAPIPWCFDDGSELESYDTQQHWFVLEDRLFLAYTRRGLNNDHIVRHRAPLLIAEVDPDRRCLLRDTEQIAVPEMGAQLGNFGVTPGGANDAWLCASEWMETGGRWSPYLWEALERRFPEADLDALAALPGRCGLCELGGSDNHLHLVRIHLNGVNAR